MKISTLLFFDITFYPTATNKKKVYTFSFFFLDQLLEIMLKERQSQNKSVSCSCTFISLKFNL